MLYKVIGNETLQQEGLVHWRCQEEQGLILIGTKWLVELLPSTT